METPLLCDGVTSSSRATPRLHITFELFRTFTAFCGPAESCKITAPLTICAVSFKRLKDGLIDFIGNVRRCKADRRLGTSCLIPKSDSPR